jgi:hypothetical protein
MAPNPNIPSTATEAVPLLVALLQNLSPEDQKRAVSAAMILLGQPMPGIQAEKAHVQEIESFSGVSPKATQWMQKFSITEDQLTQVFSISPDEVDVIASTLPSDSKRQQTSEAYILCGLRSLIRAGEGRFDDKEARILCEKLGCYDPANHSNYMKAFGNVLSGSKESGWKLTNPGVERAAHIVKKLTERPTV